MDTEPLITFEDIEARQRQDELGISQTETLDLRPHQNPTDDFFWEQDRIEEVLAAGPQRLGSEYQCAVLAKRLLDAGLSLYEPDPERALTDPEYRQQIKARVRQLQLANKKSLTDSALATVIKLAPYPILHESYEDPGAEKALAHFRRSLVQQPACTIAACEEVLLVMWEDNHLATRSYDDDGKLIPREPARKPAWL